MSREMLNPVPVMTFLNKDRYAAVVLVCGGCCCYAAEIFNVK